MHKVNVLLAVAAALGLVLAGCDSGGGNMEDSGPETVWEESFESGTGNWTTDETSGPTGWCGDIAQVGSGGGSVSPSSGSGYATAAHGACNDFWVDQGFPSSGPFGPFGEYNDEVGFEDDSGFIKELDVYLDPSWAAPDTSLFTYAISFDLLDAEYPSNFRYFFVPVVKPNETIRVASEEINAAGWYTFRHRLTSEDGSLAAEFELLRNGEVLVSQDLTATSQSGADVSSFEVSNVGTGYAWFVAIRPGLQVPIDEQTLFRYPVE